MKYSFVPAVSALVAAVNAQSAPDFPVEVDTTFTVAWDNNSTIADAGNLIPRDSKLR